MEQQANPLGKFNFIHLFLSLRFGLGKVHEQLKQTPPQPAAATTAPTDGPPEANSEGHAEEQGEVEGGDFLLQYPVDLTEPMYRWAMSCVE